MNLGSISPNLPTSSDIFFLSLGRFESDGVTSPLGERQVVKSHEVLTGKRKFSTFVAASQ